jgi:hypothetical protein
MDGFVDRLHALRFLRACDPSYRALTFPLVGLPPTEHLSLSWTYHAVATTPAGPIEPDSLVRFHRRRPSPDYSWVGSCIISFEACSAFTRVTTCRLAESPYATLSTRGFSGFVASTAAPIATGWSDPVPGRVFHPAVDQRLSRRTVIAWLHQVSATSLAKTQHKSQTVRLTL